MLSVGFTGLLNLGFAAFYACGAYNLCTAEYQAGTRLLGLPAVSALFTSCVGFLLAVPAMRLRGDYLAIRYARIRRDHAPHSEQLGQPYPWSKRIITGIAPPMIADTSLSDLRYFYYLVLIILLLSLMVIRRVELFTLRQGMEGH